MMMINDNDDNNSANNNVAENAPWNFDDESASSDEDYDYNNNRHGPVNNNNSNIVGIPEDVIQQNQQAREIFLRSMSPLVSDGSGLSVGHYTRRIVISGVEWLKSLAQRSFDALSQNAQNLVGNFVPGQACVVYLSSDIVACYHATGHVHFTEDNVAELTRRDIKICGAVPILKTLTKEFGDNSLKNRLGGNGSTFSNLDMTTPTLHRMGVFVVFLHDENVDPWDEIVIDHDSENKLVAAMEEARNRRSLETFSIYSAEDPRVLLKIVNGVRGLRASVGSVGGIRVEAQPTTSTGHTLPGTTAAIRAEIEEAGGGLYHRNISGTEKAFYICITPEDSTESPVANAEARFSELMNRVHAYSSQNRGGIAQDFHWLIYTAMENNQSEMGPLRGHGKGVNTLKRKLSDLTTISATTFDRHWKKSPTGSKLGKLSKNMWNDQRNSDGTLYHSKANMWVKVVASEQERLDLV